jgi:hypothetical protein
MLTNLGKVGHAPSALFAERRLTGFVSFELGDVGNLSPHFEHDLFDATSGRKIATRRTPRRHAAHGCERDAHNLVYQRIDIRLADKVAALFHQPQLKHLGLGSDVLGIGLCPCRSPLGLS